MSHPFAGNSQLPLLLLVILAATACSKSPPKQAGDADSLAIVAAMEQGGSGKAATPAVVVPKELVPVAIAATQKQCGEQWIRVGPLAHRPTSTICKDYEVSPENDYHLQLRPADRANGFEDTWCVTVAFLGKAVPRDPWKDDSFSAFYVKQGGAWHFESAMLTCR